MQSTDSSIHVALAADDNYFKGLIVTAWSIAANCAPSRHVTIHVLDGGISDANWRDLLAATHPFNCALDRIAVNPNASFDGLGEWHGASKMTYARLLLPALLRDIRHVIYSDVDFVWLGDISRLWDLADKDLILQYVPERTKGREVGAVERAWIESRGFTLTPGKYFCAGMIVMNLALFRKENLHAKILKFLSDNGGTAPFVDQTALNVFMDKRTDTGELPQNWQAETGNPEECSKDVDLAIHYPSDAPWKSLHKANHLLTEPHILWHTIYAHIYSTTVWRSLRSCNSALDIVFCRTLYLLASNLGIVRAFLRAYLRITGKKSGIPYLEPYLHKITFARFPTFRDIKASFPAGPA